MCSQGKKNRKTPEKKKSQIVEPTWIVWQLRGLNTFRRPAFRFQLLCQGPHVFHSSSKRYSDFIWPPVAPTFIYMHAYMCAHTNTNPIDSKIRD